MRVVIFGASGMIGHGVLTECISSDAVDEIVLLLRSRMEVNSPKVRQVVHRDFSDLSSIAHELRGLDACYYCLGVSSVGISEAEYTTITYDYTMEAARVLLEASPNVLFVYVSGEGTKSSGSGRSMWARVKGRTENELLSASFSSYMFRPGFVQPRGGVTSKTRVYRLTYAVTSWLHPALQKLLPNYVTNAENIGRAMIAVASGTPQKSRIVRSRDINTLANVR